MKPYYTSGKTGSFLLAAFFAVLAFFPPETGIGQTCPSSQNFYLTQSPNTYYPGTSASLGPGGKSITLGAAGFGATPISTGDILLLIQIQGAPINGTNNDAYGDDVSGGYGNGYIANNNLMAGNMEYVVASNSVPLTGGTLSTQSGFINAYQNSNYTATSGQYRYEVVRVQQFYTIQLWNTITVPAWNGTSGGVLVLDATDSIVFNGHTIDGSAAGFRGGGGRSLSGGIGSNTTYYSMSTINNNGAKGEGIAGTPRYVNNAGLSLVDNGAANEGYPGGSNARGAPGNAGGGGTDYDPSQNDQNTGGGGGGNGGIGGLGGNSWSTNEPVGGQPGAGFGQTSPKRFVLGGGGGAGTTNNATGNPINGLASSGMAGGGIVILMANAIGGTGAINVNGGNGYTTVQNDGSGGGGAGGSVMIYSATGSSLAGITVTANGGTGGTNSGAPGTSTPWHGPGGGGGGGVIYSNLTLNASSSASGGASGLTAGSVPYGALSGVTGVLKQNITQIQTPIFPSNCTILPLEFISVTANNNNGMVAVGWEVTREVDVQEYIVERSTDGSNFTTAGIVSYKTSDEADNLYNYTDNAGLSIGNTLYYRIEGIDQSGQPIYSKTVVVRINGNSFNQNLSVFPNPVAGSATISFTSASDGPVSLRLVDMGGRTVWQKNFEASAGPNTLALDNPSGFSNGIYSLQWSNGTQIQNSKVLINH